MLQADSVEDSSVSSQPIRGSVWPALRIIFLAALVITRGLSLVNGADPGLSDLWLLLGTATILALLRDSLRKMRRNCHKRERYRNDLVPLAHIIRRYCVPELGGLFIYLPLPQQAEDQEIWTLLPALRDHKLIKGGPWWLDARRKPPWLKASHPHLCTAKVSRYEVYRLSPDFSGMLR